MRCSNVATATRNWSGFASAARSSSFRRCPWGSRIRWSSVARLWPDRQSIRDGGCGPLPRVRPPSPLGAQNAMGPGELQQRLREEETIHQFQGPVSEGHGAFLMSPVRHRDGLNYGLLSTTGRRALCQRIGRDAFPEKVWEAKLTSNVAGLTINYPTKLTFLQ